MKRICMLLWIGIATSTLAAAAQAHEVDATQDVQLFLNRQGDGLALTALAPSARNATTFSVTGSYYPDQGLELVLPLSDPNPGWVIDEEQGVDGWVDWEFRQKATNRPFGLFYNYGHFEWLLVEGERSSRLELGCSQLPDDYSCDEYRYFGQFPGHGEDGAPHTHGDGASAERGLHSGDVRWLLTYTIAPCESLDCFGSYAPVEYTFSIVLDGSTFLHYVALDEDHAASPADPVAPSGANGTANETTNETEEPAGNETKPVPEGSDNSTQNGTAGSAFRPRPYNAREAAGTAPGASLAAMLATVGAAAVVARRRNG